MLTSLQGLTGSMKDMGQRRLGMHAQTVIIHTLSYIILITIGISMLIPFVWMVSTSLKNLAEAQVYPPRWIPDPSL